MKTYKRRSSPLNFVKVGLCEFSFTDLQLYSSNCSELRGIQKNKVMK